MHERGLQIWLILPANVSIVRIWLKVLQCREICHTLKHVVPKFSLYCLWHLFSECPVCLIKHFSLSHVRGEVIWLFDQCALLFTASAVLKECIFDKIIFSAPGTSCPAADASAIALAHLLSPPSGSPKSSNHLSTFISAAKSLPIFLAVMTPNMSSGYTNSSPSPRRVVLIPTTFFLFFFFK